MGGAGADELGRTTLNHTLLRRSHRSILSWLFLLLSVGLFAAGAILFVQDRRAERAVQVPDAAPGQNELIHVVSALEAEGTDVEYLTGADSVSSKMLERVGQPLMVDGARLYVFVYPDAAERDAVTLDVLPEDVDLLNNAGDPVEADGLRLFTGSNVATVLAGGDEELGEKVAAALGRLP